MTIEDIRKASQLQPDRVDALETATFPILAEAIRAEQTWGKGYHSPHEFYGVLMEECGEFLEAMRANYFHAMKSEAIQIAAVALRFVESAELPDEYDGDPFSDY